MSVPLSVRRLLSHTTSQSFLFTFLLLKFLHVLSKKKHKNYTHAYLRKERERESLAWKKFTMNDLPESLSLAVSRLESQWVVTTVVEFQCPILHRLFSVCWGTRRPRVRSMKIGESDFLGPP